MMSHKKKQTKIKPPTNGMILSCNRCHFKFAYVEGTEFECPRCKFSPDDDETFDFTIHNTFKNGKEV